MAMNYYVYAYLRDDGSPYYIGKGKGRRAWSKNHTINLPLDKDKIVILKENLSNDQSNQMEKVLIGYYGRKDLGTGILRNQTDGGDGLANPSDKERNRRRERMIGDKNPSRQEGASEKIKAIQNRPEVIEAKRAKMSGKLAPHYGKKGVEHPRYGIKESIETKIKKSKSATGKEKSLSHRQSIGKAHKGMPKPNSGKGNTNVRGRKWFNDGTKSFMLDEGDPRTNTLSKGRVKNV